MTREPTNRQSLSLAGIVGLIVIWILFSPGITHLIDVLAEGAVR